MRVRIGNLEIMVESIAELDQLVQRYAGRVTTQGGVPPMPMPQQTAMPLPQPNLPQPPPSTFRPPPTGPCAAKCEYGQCQLLAPHTGPHMLQLDNGGIMRWDAPQMVPAQTQTQQPFPQSQQTQPPTDFTGVNTLPNVGNQPCGYQFVPNMPGCYLPLGHPGEHQCEFNGVKVAGQNDGGSANVATGNGQVAHRACGAQKMPGGMRCPLPLGHTGAHQNNPEDSEVYKD
jgi:hypothetical protein